MNPVYEYPDWNGYGPWWPYAGPKDDYWNPNLVVPSEHTSKSHLLPPVPYLAGPALETFSMKPRPASTWVFPIDPADSLFDDWIRSAARETAASKKMVDEFIKAVYMPGLLTKKDTPEAATKLTIQQYVKPAWWDYATGNSPWMCPSNPVELHAHELCGISESDMRAKFEIPIAVLPGTSLGQCMASPTSLLISTSGAPVRYEADYIQEHFQEYLGNYWDAATYVSDYIAHVASAASTLVSSFDTPTEAEHTQSVGPYFEARKRFNAASINNYRHINDILAYYTASMVKIKAMWENARVGAMLPGVTELDLSLMFPVYVNVVGEGATLFARYAGKLNKIAAQTLSTARASLVTSFTPKAVTAPMRPLIDVSKYEAAFLKHSEKPITKQFITELGMKVGDFRTWPPTPKDIAAINQARAHGIDTPAGAKLVFLSAADKPVTPRQAVKIAKERIAFYDTWHPAVKSAVAVWIIAEAAARAAARAAAAAAESRDAWDLMYDSLMDLANDAYRTAVASAYDAAKAAITTMEVLGTMHPEYVASEEYRAYWGWGALIRVSIPPRYVLGKVKDFGSEAVKGIVGKLSVAEKDTRAFRAKWYEFIDIAQAANLTVYKVAEAEALSTYKANIEGLEATVSGVDKGLVEIRADIQARITVVSTAIEALPDHWAAYDAAVAALPTLTLVPSGYISLDGLGEAIETGLSGHLDVFKKAWVDQVESYTEESAARIIATAAHARSRVLAQERSVLYSLLSGASSSATTAAEVIAWVTSAKDTAASLVTESTNYLAEIADILAAAGRFGAAKSSVKRLVGLFTAEVDTLYGRASDRNAEHFSAILTYAVSVGNVGTARVSAYDSWHEILVYGQDYLNNTAASYASALVGDPDVKNVVTIDMKGKRDAIQKIVDKAKIEAPLAPTILPPVISTTEASAEALEACIRASIARFKYAAAQAGLWDKLTVSGSETYETAKAEALELLDSLLTKVESDLNTLTDADYTNGNQIILDEIAQLGNSHADAIVAAMRRGGEGFDKWYGAAAEWRSKNLDIENADIKGWMSYEYDSHRAYLQSRISHPVDAVMDSLLRDTLKYIADHQPDNAGELILYATEGLTITFVGAMTWVMWGGVRAAGSVVAAETAYLTSKLVTGTDRAYMAAYDSKFITYLDTLLTGPSTTVARKAVGQKASYTRTASSTIKTKGAPDVVKKTMTTIVEHTDGTITHVAEKAVDDVVDKTATVLQRGLSADINLSKRKMSMLAQEKLDGEALAIANKSSVHTVTNVVGDVRNTYIQHGPKNP